MTDGAPDGEVAEVLGPPLTRVQVAALLGLGVVSLVMTGLQSALLGALADEGRLSAPGVGFAAMGEAITMALTVAGASVALRPERLRLWGLATTVTLLVATGLTVGASGAAVFGARALAGAAEGLMLWLASSMIARTQTPERWAAILFLALSLVEVAGSAALGAWVLPRFGAGGGYALVAAITLPGFALALLSPTRLGPLPTPDGESRGAPSPRGWIGLGGTVIYTAAAAAVSVYLVPLAQAQGLGAGAGRFALTAGLGAQIAGSALAATLAGRVGYLTVFAVVTLGMLGVWAEYGLVAGAAPFVAASALGGVLAMFVPPFLLPMLIQADPTRRAALQSAGAQLLAGALGPLTAAWAVGAGGMRLMLEMSAGLALAGFAVFCALRFTTTQDAIATV